MSQDRIVYSFIVAWIVLVLVLIVLDWLGNPNRGSFRPKGERSASDRLVRRADRDRQRLDEDSAVRAALRDAYGASSLRLSWNHDEEERARQLDDRLVEDNEDVIDAGSRVIDAGTTDEGRQPVGDGPTADEPPAPIPAPTEPGVVVNVLQPEVLEPAPETEPAQTSSPPRSPGESDPTVIRGWRVGVPPLARTSRGTAPAAATVRARAWKNHALTGGWDRANLNRLRAGKPPRRTNPITGDEERASVDAATGRASWGDEPIDPFARDSE